MADYSLLQMPTTIQVSEALKRRLAERKQHPRETYEDVIQRALEAEAELDDWEDGLPLSKQSLAAIERARKDVRAGKGLTTEQLLRELRR